MGNLVAGSGDPWGKSNKNKRYANPEEAVIKALESVQEIHVDIQTGAEPVQSRTMKRKPRALSGSEESIHYNHPFTQTIRFDEFEEPLLREPLLIRFDRDTEPHVIQPRQQFPNSRGQLVHFVDGYKRVIGEYSNQYSKEFPHQRALKPRMQTKRGPAAGVTKSDVGSQNSTKKLSISQQQGWQIKVLTPPPRRGE